MLQYDKTFRAAFLDKVPGTPALDADADWTVEVETPLDRFCDATMRAPGVFVLIENKIASSAKRKGQLLTYCLAALKAHEADQVVGIYVGPTAETGRDETERVERSGQFRARRDRAPAELMMCLGWKDDMPDIVEEAAGGNWFATSGLRGIHAMTLFNTLFRWQTKPRDSSVV
jgi:hypothetical protein